MNHPTPTKALPAFTLVELILAILILALVVGTVHGTLRAGLTAYSVGQADMELYQSARVGLNRVGDLLRSALSPLSFWRPTDRIRNDIPWEELRYLVESGEMVEEEEPGAIRFLGTGRDVTFARKVFGGSSDKFFDIQEVRLYLDEDRQEIRLQLARSLLDIKEASWYFAYLYQINLNGMVVVDRSGRARRFRQLSSPDEPYLEDFIGGVGQDGRSMSIAPGIRGIEFAYFDGEDWGSSWDSQEIIRLPSQLLASGGWSEMDPQLDFVQQEKGLPAAVSVTFTLRNGEKLGVRVDIPAGNLNHLGMRAQPRGETATAQPRSMMYRPMVRRRL